MNQENLIETLFYDREIRKFCIFVKLLCLIKKINNIRGWKQKFYLNWEIGSFPSDIDANWATPVDFSLPFISSWYFIEIFFSGSTERDDYRYSGSENEEDEPAVAGEPSSIVQAPGGDTLRRNFQQIQEGRTLTQDVPQQPQILAKEKPSGGRGQREIPEPGPPARPAIPHRLIGKYDTISTSQNSHRNSKNVMKVVKLTKFSKNFVQLLNLLISKAIPTFCRSKKKCQLPVVEITS